MAIDYVKYNSLRKKEFTLKTVVGTDDVGEAFVKKIPMTGEAAGFVSKILQNRDILSSYYKNIKICPCAIDGGGIRFDYIRGDSFQSLLLRLVDKRAKKEYLDLLYRYRELFLDAGRLNTKKITRLEAGFEEVFGHFDVGKYGFESIEASNVDLSFDNFIFQDGSWFMIDYEWMFTFPVPIKYIIYRNTGMFFAKFSQKLKAGYFVSFEEVMKLFDILPEDMEVFSRMEENFQRYVHGGGTETYNGYLKNVSSIEELESQTATARENMNYAKLYWLDGEYSEKNSLTFAAPPVDVPRGEIRSHKMSVDVPSKHITHNDFRVDVSLWPCAFRIGRAYVTDKFGGHVADICLVRSNSSFTSPEGYRVFPHDDSQLIFAPVPLADGCGVCVKLVLEIELANWHELLDSYLCSQNSQNTHLREIREQLEGIVEHYKIDSKTLEDTLNAIYASKSWKLISFVKKILGKK